MSDMQKLLKVLAEMDQLYDEFDHAHLLHKASVGSKIARKSRELTVISVRMIENFESRLSALERKNETRNSG